MHSLSDEEVLRIHRDATVFLAYNNPAVRFHHNGVDHTPFYDEDPKWQGSFRSMRAGGVDVTALSFGVPGEGRKPSLELLPPRERERRCFSLLEGTDAVLYILRCLDDISNVIALKPGEVGIAHNMEEVEALNAAGKMAVILHLTGAWIHNDLALLRTYHRLGVRCIHICLETLMGIGDGSSDIALDGGLSPFGREVVLEMNKLGMVVDVAHAADTTVRDVLETSNQPVITSHTWCRALRPGVRGLPDDLIRAIADKGGVVGLFLISEPEDATVSNAASEEVLAEAYRRIDAMFEQYGDRPYEYLTHRYDLKNWDDLPGIGAGLPSLHRNKPLTTVIEHIDHVVRLVGPDHVGLGPDYEIGDLPCDLQTAAQLPNLTAGLLQHGYSEEDVKKILGGNFLRVFRQVTG